MGVLGGHFIWWNWTFYDKKYYMRRKKRYKHATINKKKYYFL